MKRDFNFYDENYFRVSHSYLYEIKDILNKKIENIVFYPHEYKIRNQKRDLELFCELVTSQFVFFGKMYFFKNFLLFETKEDPRDTDNSLDIFIKYFFSTKDGDNKTSKKKSILIFTDEIIEVIERRILFSYQSIEIFHKNGKSYFFNFFNLKNIQKVYNYLNRINKYLLSKNCSKFSFNTNNNNEQNINNILNSFQKGKMSNYEYLLYLNKYATRTYNDLICGEYGESISNIPLAHKRI